MNILIASHSPTLTTGYGRVTREFSKAILYAGHKIRVIGAGYQGEYNPQGFPIFPSSTTDAFGDSIRAQLADRWPDVILTIGDPWMFIDLPAIQATRGINAHVPWVACYPIDSRPVPTNWHAWARSADANIVFSEYAARAMKEDAGIVDTIVVPHGVDRSIFRPLDRHASKARVGVTGKFVVGTVAINQQRKNLPALIEAFAHFAGSKTDVVLYLHTLIDGYYDLQHFLDTFGVTHRAKATLGYDPVRGLSDADLSVVYNSFDIFVLPTTAEGFGLPLLESQACGVPALATDCSSCTELLPNLFQRIPVRETVTVNGGMSRSLIDVAELAARLDRLYSDHALREELSRSSSAFATRFDWETVTRPLVRVVEDVVTSKRGV